MLDVDLFHTSKSRGARAPHPSHGRSLSRPRFGGVLMAGYRFSIIVPTGRLTHDEILDATDALGNAGCTDASIRGHGEGIELLFERSGKSLEATLSSAI